MTDLLKRVNTEKLFALMRDNPHLPIIPLVQDEVVGDDTYCYWMGSWGESYIDKALEHEGRVFFYDDDPEEVLSEIHGWDYYDALPEEDVKKAFDALPWQEAIYVYINTP